ncbi:MAG: tRNA (cytidine(56)-2'-O)-methyltransferase [Methanomassiliicoccales archaeon]|nr:MAG: tRNA (cytidine(56)-2'-O)-methyltransferase [Methanomassiliicoccales archaeon]
MAEIWILRLGHRPERDKRITTHVALTARTFGAKGIFISTKDQGLEESVSDVVDRFGGDFEIRSGVGWRKVLDEFKEKGRIVHLTMYGMPVDEVTKSVPLDKDLLIVVGAEKVPAEVYQIADYNISVGNQPHSEVAALAILLDRLTQGSWVNKEFPGGSIKVLPSERGKHVVNPTEREGMS